LETTEKPKRSKAKHIARVITTAIVGALSYHRLPPCNKATAHWTVKCEWRNYRFQN